ncbi:uncharacterized protein N0V89_006028 [Didymosphaeria variabile]|uniref:HD domain-containing protein n=1 Tax=Didymosphaeria variabile TaxID=1932322 RepID=A0A9W9CC11_9PLEO|nr:uncharacterized protein N0V89_006028 [Didymosphaeria variabile]KAJ4354294.1 hypothetical protein N0V89_006028 [Didymosphaeria variabile]
MTALPTRMLAGVTVPDTPLISKAINFARKHGSESTYNHVLRSLLLGFIIADKILPSRDREVHAIAALLHDLGFPIGHPPESTIISEDKRFEIDGAHAARAFLRKEGLSEDWDEHRLQLVWDAIALHTIGSIVFEKEPEEFPRLGLMKELKANMCSLCVSKPQTTYDNTVGEWGDKFVKGYDRKGKLTQDLLETCNLDEIEPR